MRVIAGTHGGRRLVAPDTDQTRPISDRVKEAVFSSLGEAAEGARVLDLYAGAGSFGIEALSRGAAAATFVENGRAALAALERNLATLGLGAVVAGRAVERFLASAEGAYDLVFVDPPWALATADLEQVLAAVARLLAPQGTVVVTRRASDTVPAAPGLRIAADRRYGDTRIIRYVADQTA